MTSMYHALLSKIARGAHTELRSTLADTGYLPIPPADQSDLSLLAAAAIMADEVALAALWNSAGEPAADLDNAFRYAAQFAAVAAVRWLLDHGVNAGSIREYSVVLRATEALAGEAGKAMLLALAKEAVEDDWSLLKPAPVAVRIATLVVLLDAGADPNLPVEDFALLSATVSADHEIVALLIERGADMSVTNGDGRNALALAAVGGGAALVRKLLAAGAAVNHVDRKGLTPLFHAAIGGHAEAVAALLEHGAAVNAVDVDGADVLTHLASFCAPTDQCPDPQDLVRVVDMLVDAGIQVDGRDHQGTPALVLLVERGFAEPVMARILARAQRREHVQRALLAAVRAENLALVTLLLKAPLAPDGGTRGRGLILAHARRNLDIIHALLSGFTFTPMDLEPALAEGLDVADARYVERLLSAGASLKRSLEATGTQARVLALSRDSEGITRAALAEILTEEVLYFPESLDRNGRMAFAARFKQSLEYRAPGWSVNLRYVTPKGVFTAPFDLRVVPYNDVLRWEFSERRIETRYETTLDLEELGNISLFGESLPLTAEFSASLLLSRCDYSFPDDAACYPMATVRNNSDSVAIAVHQNGEALEPLAPGAIRALDRSLGEISLSVSVATRTALRWSIEVITVIGPPLLVADEDDKYDKTSERLAVYADTLRHRQRVLDPSVNALERKTSWTVVSGVSACLLHARWDVHVRGLLRDSRNAVVDIRASASELRRFFYEYDDLSVDLLPQLRTRVAVLLVDSRDDPSTHTRLRMLEKAILEASDAVSRANHFRELFEDELFRTIETQVARFQTLVLENAQYMSDTALAELLGLSPETRAHLGRVILPVECFIKQDSLAGRGRQLLMMIGQTDE